MIEPVKVQYYKSPFGELLIGSYKNQICLCDWRFRQMRDQIDKRIQDLLNTWYIEESTDIIERLKEQLYQYFQGERKEFDLPLLLVGTDFQKMVWETLLSIPFGEKDTYLGLSRKMNMEKAIRAVASANGANAISIIIPCHRIIGSDGKLVGYAGGLSTKKKLLELEGSWNPAQLSLF